MCRYYILHVSLLHSSCVFTTHYISMAFRYLCVSLFVCLRCVRMYITHVYPICMYTYTYQEELLACVAACQKAGDELLKSARSSAFIL